MKLSTTTLSALLAGLAMAQSTFWACKLDDASGTCYEFAKVDGKDSRTPNEPVPCLEDSATQRNYARCIYNYGQVLLMMHFGTVCQLSEVEIAKS
ncbi:predicted protein [Plenodomus lingam JN3]|uniref:Predicted protein n=1 Tax=Leptosphaeria maculans (strain JN3 / isolate v23.1.3 / race Av1-4-5-6-7-8) TaxID=985895 RepID=E4ZSM4_LEPMJ|nr:predicted protein [Plenodomus lingam JN3]CBX94404.1 predicted protein [Plenodomus lingam JN3]